MGRVIIDGVVVRLEMLQHQGVPLECYTRIPLCGRTRTRMNGTNVGKVVDVYAQVCNASIPDDFVDTDQAFENFLQACQTVCILSFVPPTLSDDFNAYQAGPDRCALASDKSTARSIGERVDQLLSDIYDYPLPVVNAKRPGALTSGMVRGIVIIIVAHIFAITVSSHGNRCRVYILRHVWPTHLARTCSESRRCDAREWHGHYERRAG